MAINNIIKIPVFSLITVGIAGLLVSCNQNVCCNNHEYVDLGLSVKWATCNIGAFRPEDSGDYFAWGATEPFYETGYSHEYPQQHWKEGRSGGYTCVNAPYQTKNTSSYLSTTWIKYLGDTLSSYIDPNATVNDAMKTVLELEDDAAHVNWGGDWRMPTKEEIEELTKNCSFILMEQNGVFGCRIQSKVPGFTNKWIFIPAADYLRFTSPINSDNPVGVFWSSSLCPGYPASAKCFDFHVKKKETENKGRVLVNSLSRFWGLPIRPVLP